MIVEVNNNIPEKIDNGEKKKKVKKCKVQKSTEERNSKKTSEKRCENSSSLEREKELLPSTSRLSKKISKKRITYKTPVSLIGVSTIQANVIPTETKKYWVNVTYLDQTQENKEHVAKVKFGNKNEITYSDSGNVDDCCRMNLRIVGKVHCDENDYCLVDPDNCTTKGNYYKNPLRPEFYELNLLNRFVDKREAWHTLNQELF